MSRKLKLFVVDDEPEILKSFTLALGKVLEVETAASGEEALKAIKERGPFAVVVADLKMPEMDGISFLEQVRKITPDTVRILLTGYRNYEACVSAVNRGFVFKYLHKPLSSEKVMGAISDALKLYRQTQSERNLLRDTLRGSVAMLVDVLSLVSPQAFSRSEGFRELAVDVAKHVNSSPWQLEMAAALCQLGCVGVSDEIITKVAEGVELTQEEAQEFGMHPMVGQGLLENIPRMEDVATIIGQQLDNFSEEQVMGARILRLVIDYDLMLGRGMRPQDCLEELEERNRKTECYDPQVLEALRGHIIGCEMNEVYELPLNQLEAGMILAEDYLNAEGTILLEKGHPVSTLSIRRLIKLGDLLQADGPLQIQMTDLEISNNVNC